MSDLDGDGRLDVVVVAELPGAVAVLVGNGDGSFGPPAIHPVGGTPGSVSTGLLNGDAAPDVVVGDVETSALLVLFGAGDGTLASALTLDAGPTPVAVAVADLNLDGAADVAVANAVSGPGTVTVLLGAGDGSFGPPASFPAGSLPSSMAIGELGAEVFGPDIVVTNHDADTVSVLRSGG